MSESVTGSYWYISRSTSGSDFFAKLGLLGRSVQATLNHM
jgi:hypothetical protein